MTTKFDALRDEVSALAAQGELLYFSLRKACKNLSKAELAIIEERKFQLPKFGDKYEIWYSEALQLVKQLLPDRFGDFTRQYKDEKRKEITYASYGISDALNSLVVKFGVNIVADANASIPKMGAQVAIVKSAEKRFSSSLFDIREVVQADLFDSELDAARSLVKNGFVRASGAVAGVVLEKHLGNVCSTHQIKSRKGHPTIGDFNQLLKDASIIDLVKWRFVQHLTDIRNLCDHGKHREPTDEEVLELIDGVDKVIKTVF
ncbi:hypothetical protein [Dyella acidisoli]|uniref:DUF4145 domain-containing protein n=1 Tax=Dyella acidisoli TaxID=1867834 RepID=A0ABQ5XIR4_9GAMM|nr:hypothetical protein [Dyella acidisoli]GLQ91595.1 hypothetical protein GCM10007901_05450 [Dyella acidisoli]